MLPLPQQEIEGFRKAQSVARAVCEDFAREARPGMDEGALAKLAERLVRSHGASGSWHSPEVRCGSHTASLSKPRRRAVLGNDDLVIVDVGPVVDGFAGDFGMTFAVGTPASGPHLIEAGSRVIDEAGSRICGGATYSTRALLALLDEFIAESGFRLGMERRDMLHPMPARGRISRLHVAARLAAHSASARLGRGIDSALSGPWCIEVMLTDGRLGAFFEDIFYFTGEGAVPLGRHCVDE